MTAFALSEASDATRYLPLDKERAPQVEDVLFRVVRATVETRLRAIFAHGDEVDAPELVDTTLREFGNTIDIGRFVESLRNKLHLFLEDRLRRRLARTCSDAAI